MQQANNANSFSQESTTKLLAELKLTELNSLLQFTQKLKLDSKKHGGLVWGNQVSRQFLPEEGQSEASRNRVFLELSLIKQDIDKNNLYVELQSQINSILSVMQQANMRKDSYKNISGESIKDKITSALILPAAKLPYAGDEISQGIGLIREHYGEHKFEKRCSKLSNLQGNGDNDIGLLAEALARRITLDRDLMINICEEVINKQENEEKITISQKVARKFKSSFRKRLVENRLSAVSDSCHIITILILTIIFEEDRFNQRVGVINKEIIDVIHQGLRKNLNIGKPILPIRGVAIILDKEEEVNFTESLLSLLSFGTNQTKQLEELVNDLKKRTDELYKITAELEKVLIKHELEIRKLQYFQESTKIEEVKKELEDLKAIAEEQKRRHNIVMNKILLEPQPFDEITIDENKQLSKQIKEHIELIIAKLSSTTNNPSLINLLKLALKNPGTTNELSLSLKALNYSLIEAGLLYNFNSTPDYCHKLNNITEMVKVRLRLLVKSLLLFDNDTALTTYKEFFNSLTKQDHKKLLFRELKIFESNDRYNLISQELASIYSKDGDRFSRQLNKERFKEALLIYTDPYIELKSLTSILPFRVIVENPLIKKRILKPEIQQKLFEVDGTFKKNNKYGQRPSNKVDFEGFSFWFKKDSQYPGMEKAAEELASRLVGEGYTSKTELLKFTFEKDGILQDPFPILASESLGEINLSQKFEEAKEKSGNIKEVLTKLEQIDSKIFSRLFLISLILTNEDAKPDNIIFNNQRLYLIDNDRCFFPAIVLEEEGRFTSKLQEKLQMKNFLFCMNNMYYEIDFEVAEEFKNLDKKDLLRKWFLDLQEINRQYNKMFGKEKIMELYQTDREDPVIIPMMFTFNSAEHLLRRMQKIDNLLAEHNNQLSHLELLLRTERKAGARYFELLTDKPQYPDSYTRWQVLSKEHYLESKTKQLGEISIKSSTLHLKSLGIKKKTDLLELMREEGAVKIPKQGQEESLGTPQDVADYVLNNGLNPIDIAIDLIEGNFTTFAKVISNESKQEAVNNIRFTNKKLTKERQEAIFKLIASVKYSELNLQNAVYLTDEALKEILKKAGDNLRVINISGCKNITENTLANIAFYCPDIEEINIGGLVNISKIKKIVFLLIEYSFPNLRKIDLSNCQNLTQIYLNAPKLQEINLTNCKKVSNKVLIDIFNNCAKLINWKLSGCDKIEYIEEKEKFKFLVLSNKENIPVLFKIANNDFNLTSLDLRNNQITAEGAKAIATALEKNQSLASLNLGWNKITIEGAKAVATALEKNQSLTSLNLGWNQITDEGAKVIATALKKSQNLTSLDLMGNQITDEGVKVIATTLKEKQNLTSLYLRGNQITDEGVKAIATALEKNQNLISLDLGRNDIDEELLQDISQYLKRNYKIRDDFLSLTRQVINQESKMVNFLPQIQNTPVGNKIYTLVEIIKEAGKASNQGQNIGRYLVMIDLFLQQNLPIKGNILEAAQRSSNLQIQELVNFKLQSRLSTISTSPNPQILLKSAQPLQPGRIMI
jgi:hypothetical protein